MSTQGEDIQQAIDRLGDKILQAAEMIAGPLGLVAIALSGVAAAIRPPRKATAE